MVALSDLSKIFQMASLQQSWAKCRYHIKFQCPYGHEKSLWGKFSYFRSLSYLMALPSDRFHVLHAHVLEISDRVLRLWLLAEKEELIILNWVRLEALVHWAQVQQQVIEVVSWPSYDLKATARDCLLQGCVDQSLLRHHDAILLTASVDEFRDSEPSLIIVADAAVLFITLHLSITHAARRLFLLITCLAVHREVLGSCCGWWIASRYFLRWCLRLATKELFLLFRCCLLASFKHFRPAEAVSESKSFRGAVDCCS